MSFSRDAYIAQVREPRMREVMQHVYKDASLQDIRQPQSEWALNRRKLAIAMAHNAGVKEYPIACVLGLSVREVKDYIRAIKKDGIPVQTMNWGAFA